MSKHIKTAIPEGIPLQLGQARRVKGLTQSEVAERLGVPQSHLSKIESGKVDLRLSSLVELARVLELEFILAPRSLVPVVRKILDTRAESEDRTDAWLYRVRE